MAVVLAGLVGGCSLGGDEEPEPASGAPREIAAVMSQLERAVAARDWDGVCRDLLSAGARERSGGRRCASELDAAAGQLRRPSIELTAIEVDGERARVRVRTRAAGQATVPDVVLLQREAGEWRVEALAD